MIVSPYLENPGSCQANVFMTQYVRPWQPECYANCQSICNTECANNPSYVYELSPPPSPPPPSPSPPEIVDVPYKKILGMACNVYYYDQYDDDDYNNYPVDWDPTGTNVANVDACKALCTANRDRWFHSCTGFVFQKAYAGSTNGNCQMHHYHTTISTSNGAAICTPSETDDSYFDEERVTVYDNAANYGRYGKAYCQWASSNNPWA